MFMNCSNECIELGKDNHFFLSREFTFRQYLDSDTCYETIDLRIIKAKESLFCLDNEVHILRRPQKFDKNIPTFFEFAKNNIGRFFGDFFVLVRIYELQ